MKITDTYILKLFITNKNRINGGLCSYRWLNKHNNIKKYLKNRYKYFNGKYRDVITLIKNKAKEWPKCKVCGKYLDKINNLYCSLKCAYMSPERSKKLSNSYYKKSKKEKQEIANKIRNSNILYYKNISKDKETKWKQKLSKIATNFWKNLSEEDRKKVGRKIKKGWKNLSLKKKQEKSRKLRDAWNSKSNKEKEKICQKRSNTYYKKSKKEKIKIANKIKAHWDKLSTKQKYLIIDKQKETKNKKSKKQKEAIINKWREKFYSKSKEELQRINAKRIKTMKENDSFAKSKEEDNVYNKLCKVFDKKSIIRQYTEERYPFACDFYIKSKDLFIECNFFWTHGNHWFNKNSKKDQKILKEWKKQKSGYYKSAVQTWTVRDPLKRKIARKNKLNYLVFFDFKSFTKWIEKGD